MSARPILFIDDNTSFAEACQLSLGELGIEVLTAASGDEAIILCAHAATASVAIVDLKMPGMDGPETIAALRERQPELKVIAMSGQSLQPYFRRLSDLGVRVFVPKPFTIATLMGSLRELEAA